MILSVKNYYQISKIKKIYLFSTIIICLLSPNINIYAASFDFGVGAGLPYGVLGANIEYYPSNNLSISAGLGATAEAGVAYDISLQYYLGTEENWNPRISVHYGTNASMKIIKICTIFNSYNTNEEYDSFEGISVGAGIKKLWGNHGLVLDILYIASSKFDDRVNELEAQGNIVDEEGGDIKYGIGYVYSF